MANLELEARVRAACKRKDMLEASDRDIAKAAGCSKGVVRRVRTGLIAAGIVPQPPAHFGKTHQKKPVHIRGGYLLLPSGRVVNELDYLKAKAKRKAKRPGS